MHRWISDKSFNYKTHLSLFDKILEIAVKIDWVFYCLLPSEWLLINFEINITTTCTIFLKITIKLGFNDHGHMKWLVWVIYIVEMYLLWVLICINYVYVNTTKVILQLRLNYKFHFKELLIHNVLILKIKGGDLVLYILKYHYEDGRGGEREVCLYHFWSN